jgi:pimeloyl-ACP methyl ester carboxylesterase
LDLTTFQPAPEFGVAMGEFLSRPSDDTHDQLWRRCAFDFDAMRERLGEQWEWLKSYNLERAKAPGLRAANQSLMEKFGMPAIPPSALAKIAVRTILIWGRHDLATALSVAQNASSRYGWRLSVIENAGDDPPIERPEEFLEALDSVLAASMREEVSQ